METRKQLKKLSNKQFAEDIKKFIKSSHEFYHTNVPEIRTLGKRLHEEYNLKGFYKVFNKLWNSTAPNENSLAVYTLGLYKQEFKDYTWRFIKPKLKEIKSWDLLDSVSKDIVGEILIEFPNIEKEIIKFAKGKSIWLKRLAIMSTIPLIKKKDVKLCIELIEMYVKDEDKNIQEAIGLVLNEIAKVKPETAKKFILKHIHMPSLTFTVGTENLKELRKLRNIKKLKNNKKSWFFGNRFH